jgi:hypothetical protein
MHVSLNSNTFLHMYNPLAKEGAGTDRRTYRFLLGLLHSTLSSKVNFGSVYWCGLLGRWAEASAPPVAASGLRDRFRCSEECVGLPRFEPTASHGQISEGFVFLDHPPILPLAIARSLALLLASIRATDFN